MKPHIFNFQIAFADTDAGGIVYHARYIEIAERARMNMFSDVRDNDGGFVIRDLAIKYLKPLRLSDKITVETRFTGHTAISMKIEQKFVKDKTEHAVMTGTVVYVNKDIKPARIPDAWLNYGGKK
jgi:acyl-CoA thioester hydrolase